MRRKSRKTTVTLFRTNLIISELEQSGCRIGSRRQYKDQRCTTVGISESFAQVKRRRLNKLFTKLHSNKVLYCGRDLKGEHRTNLVFENGKLKITKEILGMTFEGRPSIHIKECSAKSAPYPTSSLFYTLISLRADRTIRTP